MRAFAFLFPGQGSQAVAMLDAWGDHPAVRDTLREASAALGQDVAQLIHEGPKEALDLTTNTQPVMLTAGIACYRAWRAEGGTEPAAVAGHSLGEYTALVAAGALTLGDALAVGALSCPGDAGCSGGGRRRHGGDPRPRCVRQCATVVRKRRRPAAKSSRPSTSMIRNRP